MTAPVLIAFNNRADAATLSAGSFESDLPRDNLKDGNVSKVARTTSTAVADTRFRADLGENYTLRALALVNSNLSAAAQWRVRVGQSLFDVMFDTAAIDERLTYSGGVNGTAVASTGYVAAAVCPRVDHDVQTLASRGTLFEAAATNLALYSRDIAGAAWSGTASVGAAIAGVWNATTMKKIVEAAATAAHYRSQTVTVTASTAYTVSIDLKQGERTWGLVEVSGVGSAYFNLTTGAVGTTSGLTASTERAPNGCWRAKLSFTTGAAQTSASVNVYTAAANGVASYAGNGTSGIYAENLQFETGAIATSRIATTGAQVTRTRDLVTCTGSNFTDWYNAAAGTLCVEFDLHGIPALTASPLAVDDGSLNELLQVVVGSGAHAYLEVNDGGVGQVAADAGAVTAGTSIRVAATYTANDFEVSLNGAAAVADTAGMLPGPNRLVIGGRSGGAELNGHVRRVTYWPVRAASAITLALISAGGPDIAAAGGYSSGIVDALQFTFHGDTPADWAAQYNVMAAFDAVMARYVTVELFDTANAAGYLDIGRLFVADGIQPELSAESQGATFARDDLSTIQESSSGRRFGTARRRPRGARLRFPLLSHEEADSIDEMQASVGTTDEVLLVPFPDDMPRSQRYGGVGFLRELSPIEMPQGHLDSANFSWREKL